MFVHTTTIYGGSMWQDRTKILLGENGLTKLSNSHVAIAGIGGVGGYVCLMLARAGVGKLTLIDFDVVDETNINRQIVATTKTVGNFKTEVMRSIIEEINPDCRVVVKTERISKETLDLLLNDKYDYVVDAIDSVMDKVELICHCKSKNVSIVSAMGAGNRIGIPNFKVVDIYKTFNDGLAKVMRKNLRLRQIQSLDVVTCYEIATKTGESVVGSISYYPAMCGCVLAAFVVNKIIQT